ncbi:radical SAM/SPASM domain-containing protein [Tepidibacter thalassicus]|uniref:Radical SAM core domain-containing protein n=1 Tax=Tepidibacter thalassicus DSM 15285 TaxID=1123350 RepID=A0A1M5QI95_9FIRM|nr:radical SAM protein [Tepidibacter thalassicus]SHH13864.1 uncharacterized protein SAMN02744040_00970 [Tepidibacter thalassicus DSM 15285]
MANKVLKKSYYSFFIPKDDGTYLVFNSLTGAIISIHSETNILKLKKIINQDEIDYDIDDEMINFFYKRGILVDLKKDEYEFVKYCYERDIVRNTTLVLTLIVTRQCNLRCIYCYEEHEDKPMTEEVYDALLNFIKNSLQSKRYSTVAISLFGGEPFVEYNKISSFLEKVKYICEKNNSILHVSATTNGALIFPKRFEKLISLNCKYYQITIDGFKDTHDKYRISADRKGSWNRIIENLKYMASTDYDFKVTIRTNFNKEVFARAKEFYEFIKNTFDDRFSVYFEGIKKLGGKNDDKLNILESEEVSNSTINIAKIIKELNIKNDVVDMMTRPFSRVCYATKHNNFVIDYDGTVLKCTLALDDELNRIGFITKDGFMKIDEEKHANWVGKKTELNDECKKCKILPICYGGRCVNGRVHGEKYECNAKFHEKEIEQLIIQYV